MNNEYIPARYVVLSEQITTEVAQKLSKKHDMELSGSGGGLARCVNILSLSFEKLGPLSKVQLRKILIDSVEEFLSAINSNEELRPYLKNYPFTSKEIQIEIYIRDACGREVCSPNIAVATAKDGILSYKTVSKDDPYKFHSIERESYGEAFSIIKNSKK